MPNLYCTNNDCYKEGKKIKKVEYLIVHSPAVYPTIIRAQSGAGGGWYTRWNKPGVEKFAHGFIDDTGVYNFAPETMVCWHIGDKYGNAHAIGYELCELSTASEFAKVWENAVNKYAELCKKYGLSVDRILGHCEAHDKGIASDHSDPEPYFRRFGKSMEKFRADVKARLSGQNTGAQTGTAATATKQYSPYAYARVTNLAAGDHLNVRTAPNADANRLAAWPELSEGNEVDVVEMYTNGWAKVLIKGNVGYVNAHYLAITERSQPASTPALAQSYTEWAGRVHDVDPVGLIVRTGPGKGYSRLASYPKLYDGNMVSVMGEQSGYYHIRISNPVAGTHIGWVSKDYVSRG
ncbi:MULTISPECIES: N-acetylmuramoyl-L-alanine amidase [unclassified Candidatus Paralachnospira]|uniref:N-acetylmuramoyl-L-alanine amidase n=1 Tax=unclassified Candidatus Paralachnospira TaxID=3099471 RepID=UPI003F8E5B65